MGALQEPLLEEDAILENISWAAEEGQGNDSSEHAFFSLDYQHVQVPFEITLWIMLASLAKIGEASSEDEEGQGISLGVMCEQGWPLLHLLSGLEPEVTCQTLGICTQICQTHCPGGKQVAF